MRLIVLFCRRHSPYSALAILRHGDAAVPRCRCGMALLPVEYPHCTIWCNFLNMGTCSDLHGDIPIGLKSASGRLRLCAKSKTAENSRISQSGGFSDVPGISQRTCNDISWPCLGALLLVDAGAATRICKIRRSFYSYFPRIPSQWANKTTQLSLFCRN